MDRVARRLPLGLLVALCTLFMLGCHSPYHADRGAVFGGLTGAGVGAVVGNAVGNTGAGAALGAGLGAVTGAVIGSEMDDIEARNRAMIEAQLGRQVAAGAVTLEDVVAMSTAGVQEDLIINHIRAHGITRPLQASDLIMLQQQGVSTRVIAAMQEPPAPRAAPQPVPQTVIIEQPPPPIIVEPYDPFWHRPHCHHPRWHRPRSGVSWGISIYD